MKYKIICGTSCDLNHSLKKKISHVTLVPFNVIIDNQEFKDNEKNQSELLSLMKESKHYPKTSCPSPNEFYKLFDDNDIDAVFVISISSKLSGFYNSAMIAKNMYEENNPNKEIFVIDSLSAASAETLILMYLHKLLNTTDLSNEEIFDKINLYIKEMNTIFILDDISNLMKNGRMNLIQGTLANLLHLKLILYANDGEIDLSTKARGMKKAIKVLAERIITEVINAKDKLCCITHCDSLKKAEELKQLLENSADFKQVIIVDAAGLSTIYANKGGLIVSF
jgi:DegV family protein with EDD domain